MVSGYLANQFGFFEYGRMFLNKIVVPEMQNRGIKVYEPFSIMEKKLDMKYIMSATEYDERVKRWNEFSDLIGPTNKESMKNSQMMIPILDGGHSVDDGVSSEISHYAAKEYGPIIALRTDFRLAENLGTRVNAQIVDDIKNSKGKICTSAKEWYSEIGNTIVKLI